MAKPKTEAVSYLRVSSVGQVDGHGLERQEQAVTKFARGKYDVVTVYRENGVSGAVAERPALLSMLADLTSNNRPKVIIVESADRLGRSLEVALSILGECRRHGIQVLAADTGLDLAADPDNDPVTTAMTQIQAVFAELEKRRLVVKLRSARQAKRLKTGRCEGRHPYGTKEGEEAGLAMIQSLRRHGASYIAGALATAGHPTRTGKPWTRQAVEAIIRRLKEDRRKEKAKAAGKHQESKV
jgi:DNA invertase Pin-like site-specific DNA recombinase